MKLKDFLLLSFILIFSVYCEQVYRKIIPNLYPDAKCLDGSPAGLYLHEGSQKSKILIFLIGGGSCMERTYSQSLQTCYQRSKTKYGSSTLWPQTYSPQGYLSTDLSQNVFANWTKVLFLYCDGSLHQGNAKNPYLYKQQQLYFRGSVNIRQNLRWVDQKYNLNSVTDIIFGGASAGAIGAFMWTNYLQSMLERPSKVSTIIDSGLFVNTTSYLYKDYRVSVVAEMIYKIANVDEKTPLQLCNLKYTGQEWKCFFLDLAFTAVEGRILSIDSQYDIWEIVWNGEINCSKQGAQQYQFNNCSSTEMSFIQNIHTLRKKFYSSFAKFSKNSIWSISCSNHVYASINKYYDSVKQTIPSFSNNTARNAIEKFVLQKETINQIDKVVWPFNNPCAF